ncbi:NADP-dependent fatty aldehyde dehydrogenase (fragment) [Rhizobium mesoamericanum STM3625]|uniref:NADP-dependent fatty aldehyde dehydrogenase n=1 Tax=Rhizobium mesoamericanum STM3625 TaxID=1211777 RepID=K0Q565_9HYPH
MRPNRCDTLTTVARGGAGGENQGQAGIFETTAGAFLSHKQLQEEVFGASALIVRCNDAKELRDVVEHLEGQLTIAMHIDQGDNDLARDLIPLLERKAGRLIVNGFGTGVEVSHAMVHGDPFPATSDVRTTSVGSLAIERFLRPVCYQALPRRTSPCAIKDGNASVPQRVDPKPEPR